MTYLYMGLAFIIIGGIIYFFRNKIDSIFNFKKKSNKPDIVKKQEVKPETILPALARIYDNTTTPRKVYNALISKETQEAIIKRLPSLKLGRQWDYENKPVYALYKSESDYYEPLEKYFDMTRTNPPSKLHNHINQPEIAITHDVQRDKGFMDKYQHILIWFGVIAFIIFMVVAS